MKILFIEDEKELSEVGAAQMVAMGHDVWQAYNTREARSLFELNGENIDLIIADHNLPDGEGIQLIKEVKSQSPSIEFIIVSAYLNEMEIEMLESEGIPYFHKPVLYSDVLKQFDK